MALFQLGTIFGIGFAFVSMAHANWVLNNPYPADENNKKIFYSSFDEQPKTLDPARSYSSNEYLFIGQIYEPPLQYDYFARPYQLIPLTASFMPRIRYLDKNHQELTDNNVEPAYTVYTIAIKPGILFQPHPAFTKEDHYLSLSLDWLNEQGISSLMDFKKTGTRELLADDYIYQIKRLANPQVNSPIYGLMSEHIVGFHDFAKSLPRSEAERFIDLRKYPLEGIKKLDDYTFEIYLIGRYSQFMFWLAMPFFAPMPWEADKFYSQKGMDDRNLSLDWYPVGTGPFMLQENNPNRRMVLVKNPYFHLDYFPSNGSKEDREAGFLAHAGERIPFIDEAVYSLEKESIPRWNKFLQGYYDLSGISTDSYAQAIQINTLGQPTLSPSMRDRHIWLSQTTDTSIYYLGFNMLDPLVGGKSERARKLRLAISIAINYDENIAIFFNGRGKAAQGPIPPGIFGFREGKLGLNPYIYQWDGLKSVRMDILYAKQLMTEAGYRHGQDPLTGEALILHYDVPVSGTPDDKAQLDWMRKQFALIGIDLDVRATLYNRFQEKMRNGNVQLFSWGWNADYPDPENFLFMLYGPNGKVNYGGENAANYTNQAYDKLFDRMKNRDNDITRQALIDQMVEMVRHDAPWVWGINTQTLILNQQWVSLMKPNTISTNQLKYMNIDVQKRQQCRLAWNKPVVWPMGIILVLLFLFLGPLYKAYRRKECACGPRIKP